MPDYVSAVNTLNLTVHHLFQLLIYTALFIFVVLLLNNILLYRRKLKDPITVMLICGIFISVFELLWDYASGKPNLKVLGYISVCGYCCSFLVFITVLNSFILGQFGMTPKKKLTRWLMYYVPHILFFIVCVTTPWTHLIAAVDDSGKIIEGSLFVVFVVILFAYFFGALIPAVYKIITSKNKKSVDIKIAETLIIATAIIPLLYILEVLVMGDVDDYYAVSLICAVAMVYIVTQISTHLLVDAQTKFEAVEADLRIAAKIQADALPAMAPEFAEHLELNLRAFMNTAKEVGGDFYDYFPIDENRLCFLIADVSGKGTPAALFMMTAKTVIKDYALTHGNTAEIFTEVNNRLCEGNEANMFATAWIGILDFRTKKLQYTNAGHNFPMLKRKGEPVEMIEKKHGIILAAMEDHPYGQSEIQLHTGDRLVLYTDGVTEAHSKTKELYGEERLMKVIDDNADVNGDTLINHLNEDLEKFAYGVQQFDDITVMVLTLKD